MSTPIAARSLDEYQPLRTFLDQHPQFRENQLRWLLRFRDENGLAAHVMKIGRELYLHVPGFLRWLDEQRKAA